MDIWLTLPRHAKISVWLKPISGPGVQDLYQRRMKMLPTTSMTGPVALLSRLLFSQKLAILMIYQMVRWTPLSSFAISIANT